MVVHVQTKTEIRGILDSLGLRPQKRFGQHFLMDGNLMRRLADGAEIGNGDAVLEVGPGTGGLTDLLAESAATVLAVEIDRGLAAFLDRRYADRPQIRILNTDVLANKNRLSPTVTDAVTEMAAAAPGRCLLVANLPYNVATPLLINLLHELPVVTRFCFTIQRDVADRIDAVPGDKAYGPLAVVLQAVTRIQRLARVPASAFWPAPEVESAMLRLDVHLRPPLDTPQRLARFSGLLRGAFHHRRKTLKSNLGRCLDGPGFETAAGLLDLSRRPEDLTVTEWIELARQTALAS